MQVYPWTTHRGPTTEEAAAAAPPAIPATQAATATQATAAAQPAAAAAARAGGWGGSAAAVSCTCFLNQLGAALDTLRHCKRHLLLCQRVPIAKLDTALHCRPPPPPIVTHGRPFPFGTEWSWDTSICEPAGVHLRRCACE